MQPARTGRGSGGEASERRRIWFGHPGRVRGAIIAAAARGRGGGASAAAKRSVLDAAALARAYGRCVPRFRRVVMRGGQDRMAHAPRRGRAQTREGRRRAAGPRRRRERKAAACLPASGRGGDSRVAAAPHSGGPGGCAGKGEGARAWRPSEGGDGRCAMAIRAGGEDGAEARGSKSAPSPSHARLPTLPRVCARGGAAVRERGEPLMVGPRSQYSRGWRPTPRRASPRPAWARADIMLYRRAGARPTRGPRVHAHARSSVAGSPRLVRNSAHFFCGNGRGRPSLLWKAQAAADSPSRGGLLRHRVAARHNRQRRARRRPP